MGTPRTAFDADFGTRQGRIEPSEATTLSGSYVFQLGHDVPNVRRVVADLDTIQIAHTFDASGVRKFRFRARFRPPSSLPSGWTWQFTATINGSSYYESELDRAIETIDSALAAGPEIAAAGSSIVTLAFVLAARGPASQVAEVELPGCWIDAITDDPLGPQIDTFSRIPEPNETQVPLATPIRFFVSLMDGTTGLVPSDLDVFINNVLAISGGVTQFGFNGGASPMIAGFDCGIRVGLTPVDPFTPLTRVRVRIVIPSRAYDREWSFTTEDTIAPIVESAFAITSTTVRVVFDEPISNATNASDYSIELVGGAPAVTPSVLDAAIETPTSIVLTLDKIMTRGASYRVRVQNVTDLFGNAVMAPNDAAVFDGFSWPLMPGREVSLWARLPLAMRMLDETGEHERFIGVMQELLDIYYGLADRALDIIDPDYAPIEWVDIMLADLGNPFAFLELTEIEKRILVQTLLPLFRTKGTGPGIINAARFFLGIEVSIRVYAWAPFPIGSASIGQTFVLGTSTQSDLYTFEVVVDTFLTDTQRKNLSAIVEYMKVAHEHWRLIEPVLPIVIDHWRLGFSLLSSETLLHV